MSRRFSEALKGRGTLPRICLFCNRVFRVRRFNVAIGEGKYCSKKCFGTACQAALDDRIREHSGVCKGCGRDVNNEGLQGIQIGGWIWCSRKCLEWCQKYLALATCETCDTKFLTSEKRPKKFCSQFCYQVYQRDVLLPKKRQRLIEGGRPCQQCGKLVVRYPSQLCKGKFLYCSKTCSHKGKERKVTFKCVLCGKEFRRARHKIHGKLQYCSNLCRTVHSAERVRNRCLVYTPELLRSMKMYTGSDCAFPACGMPQAPKRSMNPWHACEWHMFRIYGSLNRRKQIRKRILQGQPGLGF